MAKTPPKSPARAEVLPVVLLVAAFLSSGAWMIVRLPPVPVSKALNLATAGLWLAAFALPLVRFVRPDRRVLWGLGGVVAVAVAAWIAAGDMLTVAIYDLFSDMPLVQWFAFPLVFLLASGMVLHRRSALVGLGAICVIGAALAATLGYFQIMTNGYGVFGSSAYSTTALAGLIPLGVSVAAAFGGRWGRALYVAPVLTAVVLLFFAGSTMGAVAAVFGIALAFAFHPVVRTASLGALRWLRYAAVGLAGALVTGLIFVQVPALSSSILGPQALARFDRNVAARAYMWDGAEDMLRDRPILGFGPSGYRTSAVEYLDAAALQFGPDTAGNIDPTIYSPQSPHSVLWDVAVRLGLLGVVAFSALLILWAFVWRSVTSVAHGSGDEGIGADLRFATGGAFLTAIFAMLVNPPLFAIGLFPAVVAGLTVGPMVASSSAGQSRGWVRAACGVGGAVIVLLAIWLGMGEWRAYTAPTGEAGSSIPRYEAALRIVPGHPITQRRLLEARLLAAQDDAQLEVAQTAVDTAPRRMAAYAPNLVNFAAHSLAQAQRTARSDVTWEQGLLDEADRRLPSIPSLAAEQLHAAVLAGDADAVRVALPEAERWGGPYPYTAEYIAAARELLAE